MFPVFEEVATNRNRLNPPGAEWKREQVMILATNSEHYS